MNQSLQTIKIVPLKENVAWQCPEGWIIKELQQSVTSKDTAFYVVLMKIVEQPKQPETKLPPANPTRIIKGV
jgi:hypothetical protein